MSATNTTPNIGLPSFIGTDKPAWLTDWNGAMSTIDTEIGTIKTGMSGDETRIGNLENSVSSLNTTVSNHTTSITALNGQVATQGGTINTITSLIGNGTPTTTDQTIIGAINELHADQGDLANLQTTDKSSLVAAINEAAQGGGGGTPSAQNVTYDNTTSGLSANNVQGAIDELAQSAAGIDLDLTAHVGDCTLTPGSGVTVNQSAVRYAMNDDYSLGKIYGGFFVNCTQATYNDWATIVTLSDVGVRPSAQFNVETGALAEFDASNTYAGTGMVRLVFNTDGTVDVQLKAFTSGGSGNHCVVHMPAILLILKDFGD